MAGDPLEDAFRAELNTVIAAASPAIPWVRRDLDGTGNDASPPAADAAAADAGWFEIEFAGANEEQFTSGAPGDNLHREEGQVTIRAVTRLRAGATTRNAAEAYLAAIRKGFRARRFTLTSQHAIRITGTMSMGSGEDEAGNWVKSLGLRYEVFNVG